jgi:eukaryotic-like serine/threonine-protein kinase
MIWESPAPRRDGVDSGRVIASAPQPGTRIGRYRVVGPLGRGGMGGVYEVEDERGGRFALKAPLVDVSPVGEVTRRFAREANALRMLDHPNVVAAVDVFVEAGALFLVMEKVIGQPLGRGGPRSPRQALVLVRQMLEGIGHAHALGIVHRDLKPGNTILVDMGGWERVKIIDFGLVKLVGDAAQAFGAAALTRTGLAFGTPAYMAPEQALGRMIDARVDLYAVGVILFELLAGRLPFDDPDPMVVMRLQVKAAPPRLEDLAAGAPWCTPAVRAVIDGALHKDAAHRFASAAAMITAIDAAFASIDHLP